MGTIELLKNENLRRKKKFLKETTIKKLFINYPKNGGVKNLFNNVNNHILNELGFELKKKRKQYKDKLTGKMKEYNNYTIGTCEILTNYLKRVDNKNEIFKEMSKCL